MNKTTSREENVYEEMQAAEEKRQATTRHEYAWKRDRVVLRRMLFVVAAVAVVALLIAIAALDLALTAKNLRNDSTAKGQATKKNCGEWYKSGERNSRVYTIDPDGSGAFDVFCDQTTAGGGWTVFQKRLDGSVDFYRGWADYKRGFGNLNGEFWLGLDKIHRLTSSKKYKLRVDLQNMTGDTAFAEYGLFAVGSEGTKYQLSVGSYTGAAGDRLTYHNGYPFSTKDQDNDSNGGNCAVSYKGAWWYNNCFYSNLNGGISDGWSTISSLKRAAMKIRPVDF